MGDGESGALASVESSLGYHPCTVASLTCDRYPAQEQSQVGSLTGAVASQNVTEAREGSLRLFGNQPESAKA